MNLNPNKKYTALELGDVRSKFIESMRDEILSNGHKGDWNQLNLTKNNCLAWLNEHSQKLGEALLFGNGSVDEFTADIANIAMKINELYGVNK